MAQNIYDSPAFFAEYAALPRSQHGLSEAPEWPALQAMLGSVHNQRVLDLGCGYGWFCRWAADQGALAVKGVDVSAMMVQKARELSTSIDASGSGVYEKIEYEVSDIESIELPPSSYAIVFSSLTLHYITTPAFHRLFAQISASLLPGGRVVFSVEHPIATAPTSPFWTSHPTTGKEIWPLDAYAKEGKRLVSWLGSEVLKQHRMVETYVEALLANGLRLEAYRDWAPTEADLERWGWVRCLERPIYLLMGGVKDGV